ncbi:hypothetical protein [Paenibacillus lactis]|uniref:Lipoprotein n=1 Tax=Paenibacillus lactis 154 TaxID=743719 RepID=G4HEJ9_9BACL|nr:hypothetical protein [Paenibacillus lactis]EHB65268.1 hypothetical protein PaelaDRAFT_2410 [Paenibacillus lactis 154]
MKKSLGLFAVVMLLLVAVVGCGSAEAESEKDLTLDKFIKAYQDAGIEVDPEKKPVFGMINAKDGVMFTVDKDKVAIYEYESKKDLEKNQKELELVKGWPSNGRFLLEAYNEKSQQIFENVK